MKYLRLLKNYSARSTGAIIVLEVNVANNHLYVRIRQDRKNGHDCDYNHRKQFRPKNIYQKKGSNNEQAKIWNIHVKDVKGNVIRLVLVVPVTSS